MNISNCNTILYNGDMIQSVLYRGNPCYNSMIMRIMYDDDNSYCVSVVFNSMNCTTWETLVNMYPDVFILEYSFITERYIIYINKQLLKAAPNGYYYSLRKSGNGSDVYIDDEIVFDSSNSTTYILQLESSTSVGGGSSD